MDPIANEIRERCGNLAVENFKNVSIAARACSTRCSEPVCWKMYLPNSGVCVGFGGCIGFQGTPAALYRRCYGQRRRVWTSRSVERAPGAANDEISEKYYRATIRFVHDFEEKFGSPTVPHLCRL
jgi:hypothetical protein